MKGFKEFLLRGNLIELAVAFIIGTAFAAVVTTFTQIIIDLIGKAFDVKSFSTVAVGGVNLGAFITAFVTFFLTALVVYLFIVVPYNRYQERKHGPKEDPATTEDLLAEIRDLLANRQA